LLPQVKPSTAERDDGGPFKAEMISRMEPMRRGDRVIPPCDRCRRLQMDCIKNLTACMGCTRKHARCCWKDVKPEELQPGPNVAEHESEVADTPGTARETSTAAVEETKPRPVTVEVPKSSHEETSPTRVMAAEPREFKTSPAKFDVRPPPVGPHFRDPANGRQIGQYSPPASSSHVRESVENQEPDEGDRLQALAAQVYRSASQSVRPHEG
jgi:hypothetical protein